MLPVTKYTCKIKIELFPRRSNCLKGPRFKPHGPGKLPRTVCPWTVYFIPVSLSFSFIK